MTEPRPPDASGGREHAIEPPPRAAAPAGPVLVLYAPADEPFVRGFLLPALGGAAAGAPEVRALDLAALELPALERALRESRATIAVVTPAFLDDPPARNTELLAAGAALEGGGGDVIPLVLAECTLPLHMQARVRLDLRRAADWDGELRRLRDFLERPAPAPAPLPCPYPGMRPFEAGDALHFHGRDAEIAQVLARLAAGQRELHVIGPSGSGKSSLIAAGVLPLLEARARDGGGAVLVRAMRPGAAPARRLAECLGGTVDAVLAPHPGARLVLFIDQLEELFAQAPPGEQAAFAAALRDLRADPRCTLLLALRADFFAELLLSELWSDGTREHVDLAPLRGPALRAAIENPARALDVYFEPGLIERLLADGAGEPGVLPLLQETLVHLWSRRRHHLLTLDAYAALGEGKRSGLAVAISSRADRCLRELTPELATIARRVLLRLVSFGEGRPDTRRRQPRAALGAGESPVELDRVLQALVAARLVTMDGDDRSDDQVDLCHDVLITAWPPFTAWVEARRADEQRRRQIQASADEWRARGRGASGLLDEAELATALAWRQTDAARELGETPEVTALVDASRRALRLARRRRRRLALAVLGGIAAFTAVLAALALIARDRSLAAEAARLRIEGMIGERYREEGRRLVLEGHHQRAIPYLVAARAQGSDDPGLRLLFRQATRSAVALSLPHGGPVTTASFSRDGARLVTSSMDRTARLWDAATGAPLCPPLVHPVPVAHAALSPDGTRIVTIGTDDRARLWTPAAGPAPPIELRHEDQINSVAFSADGTRIVTASSDRTVRVWDARTGAPVSPPLPHAESVLAAELDPRGARVLTVVSSGDSGGLWDAVLGTRIAPFAHDDLVLAATFSPDGARFVTASADGTARVWDAATGAPLTEPMRHDHYVRQAAFAPDGARIATAGDDGRVRLWDAATGRALGRALEHPQPVLHVGFSRDGSRLLSECADTLVRVWDAADRRPPRSDSPAPVPIATLELEAGAWTAELGPDGTRLATASSDGAARVWDVAPAAPRVLSRGARAYDGAYSPDGSHVATISESSGLELWTAAGALVDRRAVMPGSVRVLFSPDGRRLAAVSWTQEVQLWDLATGALRKIPERGAEVEQQLPPGHWVASAAFSPDGSRLATAGTARAARIWDAATGAPVTPPLPHAGRVVTVRFTPDGRRAITASVDGTARVWDAATGAPIGPPLVHPADTEVTSAHASPDGRRIATTTSTGFVQLWDAAIGWPGARLEHAAWIPALEFAPGGARLLTFSIDQSARIWDVAAGRLAVPPLEHAGVVESAAFSADGAWLVTVTDKAARVWDAASGQQLTAPLAHGDYVRHAAFSPDRRTLLTVARDGIRLWDLAGDARSLDEWRSLAERGAFPQLGRALDALRPR